MDSSDCEVVVGDIKILFFSMVILMVKWAIAEFGQKRPSAVIFRFNEINPVCKKFGTRPDEMQDDREHLTLRSYGVVANQLLPLIENLITKKVNVRATVVG